MDILKGGWHPGGKGNSGNSNNNGGSKLSANFKGIDQVRGWMGHKSSSTKEAEGRANYASAPLSSLRDPSSFGAPPKHRAYYGTGADARIDGGIGGSSSSGVVSRREDSKALSAPLSRSEMPEQAQTREAEEQRAREEANLPLSPPKPYRVDTTGLSTSNLPKPPLFRGRPGQEQQLETQPPSLPLIARAAPPTPPQRPAHTKQQQQQQRSPTAKPSLPPRLPLRQNPNPE